MTDKELDLRMMMLLSAIELWASVTDRTLPDHIFDELTHLQNILLSRIEVLK